MMKSMVANSLNTTNGDSCHHLEDTKRKDTDPNNNVQDVRILSKWKQELLFQIIKKELITVENEARHIKLTISDKEKKIRSGLDVAYNEQSIRRSKEVLLMLEERIADLRRITNAVIGFEYYSKDDYNL